MRSKYDLENLIILFVGLFVIVLTIYCALFFPTVNNEEIIVNTVDVNDCLLVTNYFEFIQQDTCEYRPVIVEVTR